MLIVPRVCAEFHSQTGEVLFTVRPHMLGNLVEAPDSIRQDLLFRLLVNEGSLKAVEDAADKKAMENDPMAGVTADGRCEADAAIAAAKSGKPAKGKGTGTKDKAPGAEAQPSDPAADPKDDDPKPVEK